MRMARSEEARERERLIDYFTARGMIARDGFDKVKTDILKSWEQDETLFWEYQSKGARPVDTHGISMPCPRRATFNGRHGGS